MVELYLSLSRRVLYSENALEADQRNAAIQNHFEKCVDLLKHRTSCK
jgi:tRNA guanosine-2'-O-methyltransferase